MTYTTFHLGLYISLITALLSFLTFYSKPTKGLYWTMVATLVCFFFAGACGGLIASSIPRSPTYEAFRRDPLTPKFLEGTAGVEFETLAAIEHTFFWIGLTIAIVGIIWHSRLKE
jgi:hypothetical protein